MIHKITFILLLSLCLNLSYAQEKYFTDKTLSIYNGYRNINIEQLDPIENIDFLNYVYTQTGKADYQYFEVATRLRHGDSYQLEASIAIYNNLEPYCYNISYTSYFYPHIGLTIGSMSNRFFLREFNGFYDRLIPGEISTRFIDRQWRFSLMGIYFGPSFEYHYNTLKAYAFIKTGVCSIVPFRQRNIIKESQSNYKLVYDYHSKVGLKPFIMPELELVIDLMSYKDIVVGCKLEFRYLVTRNSINYNRDVYEWTYENPDRMSINMPQHRFQHTDWDIGINFRW